MWGVGWTTAAKEKLRDLDRVGFRRQLQLADMVKVIRRQQLKSNELKRPRLSECHNKTPHAQDESNDAVESLLPRSKNQRTQASCFQRRG